MVKWSRGTQTIARRNKYNINYFMSKYKRTISIIYMNWSKLKSSVVYNFKWFFPF